MWQKYHHKPRQHNRSQYWVTCITCCCKKNNGWVQWCCYDYELPMFRIQSVASCFFAKQILYHCGANSMLVSTWVHVDKQSFVVFALCNVGGFMVLEWWLCPHCSHTTWPGRVGPSQSGWLCRGEPMRVTWNRSGRSTPDTFIAQKCSHSNKKHGHRPSLFRTGTCDRSDCLIHHFCLELQCMKHKSHLDLRIVCLCSPKDDQFHSVI